MYRISLKHIHNRVVASSTFLCTNRLAIAPVHRKWLASAVTETTSTDSPLSNETSLTPRTNKPFTKELFAGRYDKSMLVFPEVLEADEGERFEEFALPIKDYFENHVDSSKIDKDAEISEDIMAAIKSMGLLGQEIPADHGGLSLNATKYARLAEITSLDSSISHSLIAHQALAIKALLLFGNDSQKSNYLPKLASGEHIAAFCLNESTAGSDIASIKAKATLSEDGSTYYITGNKNWVTNGRKADVYIVFAKSNENTIMGEKTEKLSAFIVDSTSAGITHGEKLETLGLRGCDICNIEFDNTPVAEDNVLGDIGTGFKIAMDVLNSSHFAQGCSMIGLVRQVIKSATEHAISREQFQRKLKDFELIKSKLAQMAIAMYAMESMIYRTAAIMDSYEVPDVAVESAMVKIFASENAWWIVGEALSVLGGHGYFKDFSHEQFLRNSRHALLFASTNEICRLFVSLTCFQYAGGQLRDRIKKLRNPLNNLPFTIRAIAERKNDSKKNPRLRFKLFNDVHPQLSRSAEKFEARIYHFRSQVDNYLSMYGDSLIEEQLALERFANIAIDLYAVTCVLGRCSRSLAIGQRNCEHELRLTDMFVFQACEKIDTNIEKLKILKVANGDEYLTKIADDVVKHGGYVPESPLKRNW